MAIFGLTRRESFEKFTIGMNNSNMITLQKSLSDINGSKCKYVRITRSKIDPKCDKGYAYKAGEVGKFRSLLEKVIRFFGLSSTTIFKLKPCLDNLKGRIVVAIRAETPITKQSETANKTNTTVTTTPPLASAAGTNPEAAKKEEEEEAKNPSSTQPKAIVVGEDSSSLTITVEEKPAIYNDGDVTVEDDEGDTNNQTGSNNNTDNSTEVLDLFPDVVETSGDNAAPAPADLKDKEQVLPQSLETDDTAANTTTTETPANAIVDTVVVKEEEEVVQQQSNTAAQVTLPPAQVVADGKGSGANVANVTTPLSKNEQNFPPLSEGAKKKKNNNNNNNNTPSKTIKQPDVVDITTTLVVLKGAERQQTVHLVKEQGNAQMTPPANSKDFFVKVECNFKPASENIEQGSDPFKAFVAKLQESFVKDFKLPLNQLEMQNLMKAYRKGAEDQAGGKAPLLGSIELSVARYSCKVEFLENNEIKTGEIIVAEKEKVKKKKK